jgi:hypothetical protein
MLQKLLEKLLDLRLKELSTNQLQLPLLMENENQKMKRLWYLIYDEELSMLQFLKFHQREHSKYFPLQEILHLDEQTGIRKLWITY